MSEREQMRHWVGSEIEIDAFTVRCADVEPLLRQDLVTAFRPTLHHKALLVVFARDPSTKQRSFTILGIPLIALKMLAGQGAPSDGMPLLRASRW